MTASLVAVAAATACLTVPRFLLVFGVSAWPKALRSAVHNLDVSLVGVATLGICLSLIKTMVLRRPRSKTSWTAADLAATVALAIALAALERLLWHIRTGLDPGGLVGFFQDARVPAAMVCLPVAASGWVWISEWLADRPERGRRWLMSGVAAVAAGLWGGLFVPF